jgi:hypothetical protein
MAKVLSKPPQLLDSARVLHYANVDKGVGFAGRTLLFVDGKELGRVPNLAICADDSSGGVLLFHCSGAWKVFECSAHESVGAAKEKAERIYPGLSSRWVEAKANS